MNEPVSIRRAAAADEAAILTIIAETGFFRPVEVEIAREVFAQAASDAPDNYQSYVAEFEGRPAGWVCFGATPCTLGTFDIYWIAVDRALQRHRIGSALLAFAEGAIKGQQGRLIVIETSGSEKYVPTRGFYERNGYELSAVVREFYAPGDDKWIFTKNLIATRNSLNH